MIESFVAHLRKRIGEEAESIAQALSTGGAKSFDEYRHMTGILRGLSILDREINDLMDALYKE
jgi:hypothetical protein